MARTRVAALRVVALLALVALTSCSGVPAPVAAPDPVPVTPTAPAPPPPPVIITLALIPDPTATQAGTSEAAAGTTPGGGAPAEAGGPPPEAPGGRTSCDRAVHFGDSTSIGLVSPAFLRNPVDRIPAQYERVGVRASQMEIDGARSIVEKIPKQINAYDTAARVRANGFRGCWVVAMGTTDAANIARGSRVGHAERIDRMMSIIGSDPTMWVSAHTMVAKGWWSDASMQKWNEALWEATQRYPNIRVFDWTSVARPEWFTRDGIHYNSTGSAARARAIADALAVAYPQPE